MAQLPTLILFGLLGLELSSGFMLIQLLISSLAAFFYLRFFYWRYEISMDEIEHDASDARMDDYRLRDSPETSPGQAMWPLKRK